MCLESLSKILFPQIYHTFESWCVLSFCVLKDNILSLKNQLCCLRVLLKKYKTFLYNLFYDIKYVCFLCDQMAKIVDIDLWSNVPNCWDWISTRNMLTYFCCWRIFWIICTSIYFSNERFNISINNLVHFTWLHLLFKF